MKNITTHTGVLKVLTRLPSRSNGNPRFNYCKVDETQHD